MKLFQLLRKYSADIGIEPLQPFQKSRPMIVIVRRMMVFITLNLYSVLSLVFLVYEAETLNEYADSFYFSVTTATLSIIFAILLWKMDSFFKLIGEFEKLIEKRMENPQSKQKYIKLNENIEKWTGVFYFFIVNVTAPAVVVPKFIVGFYHYFTTDLGAEVLSPALPIWTTINWRTPIGYSITFIFEYFVAFFACHLSAVYFVTFTGSCYIIFTLCNEIQDEIHVLDESNKAGEKSAELMKRVGDIVEFNVAAKQLVFDVDNIFALTIIIYFVWSLASICSALLVIQMESEQHVNPLELIKPIFIVFWSFTFLLLICEFGQRLTDHFDQLTDAINDCDWTLFPKKLQKVLPIIIQNTQQEVVLETFKNASCSRESFTKVVNRGFSYFMVFRNFR